MSILERLVSRRGFLMGAAVGTVGGAIIASGCGSSERNPSVIANPAGRDVDTGNPAIPQEPQQNRPMNEAKGIVLGSEEAIAKAFQIELEDPNGRKVKLAELGKDKTLVIGFWNAGVPTGLKLLEEISPEFQGSNIQFVAIVFNRDEGQQRVARKYLQENYDGNFPVPILFDTLTQDVAKSLGLQGLPYSVIIDKQGNAVEKIHGADQGRIRQTLQN